MLVLIKKLVKNIKLKNNAITLNEVERVIKGYIGIAEGFMNFSGEEKKEWVKTKINQYAIDNGFKYNEKRTDEIIENLILLTKKVNRRDKDKEELL